MDNLRDKTMNYWNTVYTYSQDGAESVLLVLLPLQRATTLIMYNND